MTSEQLAEAIAHAISAHGQVGRYELDVRGEVATVRDIASFEVTADDGQRFTIAVSPV